MLFLGFLFLVSMFGIDLNIILLFVLVFFAFAGFWFGLLHTVGALLGTIAGSFLASRYHDLAAIFLQGKFDLNENTAQVAGFVLVFVLVSRSFGLAIWVVEKFINLSGIVPFFGTLNRVAGAIIGLIEGVLVVGLVLTFSLKFPVMENWRPQVEASGVAQSTMVTSKLLWPVVSEGVSFFQTLPDELEF